MINFHFHHEWLTVTYSIFNKHQLQSISTVEFFPIALFHEISKWILYSFSPIWIEIIALYKECLLFVCSCEDRCGQLRANCARSIYVKSNWIIRKFILFSAYMYCNSNLSDLNVLWQINKLDYHFSSIPSCTL